MGYVFGFLLSVLGLFAYGLLGCLTAGWYVRFFPEMEGEPFVGTVGLFWPVAWAAAVIFFPVYWAVFLCARAYLWAAGIKESL